MSKFRKLKQQARKKHEVKRKRQKNVFSVIFIFTIILSVSMLMVCAIHKGPTHMTTIISGSAWLLFNVLYAVAIKNKWHILSEECTTGKMSFDLINPEQERLKNNWNGNFFKFGLSLLILLIHIIILFCL